MGASFGAERELIKHHDKSEEEFRFPQKNGDIFAFTNEINKKFMHGIPKSNKPYVGPRFSIIAWGMRRSINERNGGNAIINSKNVLKPYHFSVQNNTSNDIVNTSISNPSNIITQEENKVENNEDKNYFIEIDNNSVLILVDKMISEEGLLKDKKKLIKKKKRVQHGYMKKM
jgi:hypothetical protein